MTTSELLLVAAEQTSDGPGVKLLAIAIGIMLIVAAIRGMFGGKRK